MSCFEFFQTREAEMRGKGAVKKWEPFSRNTIERISEVSNRKEGLHLSGVPVIFGASLGSERSSVW